MSGNLTGTWRCEDDGTFRCELDGVTYTGVMAVFYGVYGEP